MYRSITKNICNSHKKINRDTYVNKITKYKNNKVSLKTISFNIVHLPVVFFSPECLITIIFNIVSLPVVVFFLFTAGVDVYTVDSVQAFNPRLPFFSRWNKFLFIPHKNYIHLLFHNFKIILDVLQKVSSFNGCIFRFQLIHCFRPGIKFYPSHSGRNVCSLYMSDNIVAPIKHITLGLNNHYQPVFSFQLTLKLKQFFYKK